MEFLSSFFKLKEHNATVKTEVFAGITTFMTMAYILIVNPNILSATGMDRGALITATAISAAVGTIAMALLANYPFALAPGMGLNAFFAFTVVIGGGHSWQFALVAVLVEGILFLLLSVVNAREAIFDSIPTNLKAAVGVGIGIFITFIGFQNAGIIVNSDATLVALGNVCDVSVALAILGTLFTIVLSIKKVKGALLFGILGTYLIGVVCQLLGLYVPDLENTFSLIPSGIISAPHGLSDIWIVPVLQNFQFKDILSFEFLTIMISFLFVDVFDTVGTLVGVSTKAGFLDKNGKLPRLKEALLADAIGTTVGAAVGTSTVTTYVESAAGVTEGGRTGMTAMVTGLLFLVALVFSPIISVIPSFATAPALIVVGLFMIQTVVKINFDDYTEGFPAFITIVMMPLSYSISDGLAFGIISYVVLKFFAKEYKALNPVILVIAVLFLLKLILF